MRHSRWPAPAARPAPPRRAAAATTTADAPPVRSARSARAARSGRPARSGSSGCGCRWLEVPVSAAGGVATAGAEGTAGAGGMVRRGRVLALAAATACAATSAACSSATVSRRPVAVSTSPPSRTDNCCPGRPISASRLPTARPAHRGAAADPAAQHTPARTGGAAVAATAPPVRPRDARRFQSLTPIPSSNRRPNVDTPTRKSSEKAGGLYAAWS